MIELYINKRPVDLPDKANLEMTYSAQNSETPSAQYNSFSKTITLPGTPNNNKIFGNFYTLSSHYLPTVFDPHKRNEFELYVDHTLQQTGYVELTKINNNYPNITYSINLYGGLGGFFYSLKYDSEGKERKLSNLFWKWIPSVDGTETLPFESQSQESAQGILRMSSYLMTNAWRSVNLVNPQEVHSVLNDIVLMPTLNGTPDNNFDPSKIMISARNGQLIYNDYLYKYNRLFPTSATIDEQQVNSYPADGTSWIMATATRDMNPFETRAIPTKECCLGLRTKALLETLSKDYNNGGYTVNWNGILDSDYITHSFINLGKINTEQGIPQYAVPELVDNDQWEIFSSISDSVKKARSASANKDIAFTCDLFGGDTTFYLNTSTYGDPVLEFNIIANQEYQTIVGGGINVNYTSKFFNPVMEDFNSNSKIKDILDLNSIDDRFYTFLNGWAYNWTLHREPSPYRYVNLQYNYNPDDPNIPITFDKGRYVYFGPVGRWYLINFFADNKNQSQATKAQWTLELNNIIVKTGSSNIRATYNGLYHGAFYSKNPGEWPGYNQVDTAAQPLIDQTTINNKIIEFLQNRYGVTDVSGSITSDYYAMALLPDVVANGDTSGASRNNYYSTLQDPNKKTYLSFGRFGKHDVSIGYYVRRSSNALHNKVILPQANNLHISYEKMNIAIEATLSNGTVTDINVRQIQLNHDVQYVPSGNTTSHTRGAGLINGHNINNPWDNFIYGVYCYYAATPGGSSSTTSYDLFIDSTKWHLADVQGLTEYVDVPDNDANDSAVWSQQSFGNYTCNTVYDNYGSSYGHSLHIDESKASSIDHLYKVSNIWQAQFNRNYRRQWTNIGLNQSVVKDDSLNIENFNPNIPILTKDSFFYSSKTPYDYLIGFAKLFNWRFNYNNDTKVIDVIPKGFWYSGEQDTLELDYANIEFDPVSIRKKYVDLKLETPESYPILLTSKEFDDVVIDTKFDLNSDRINILEVPFKNSTYYNLTSPYLRGDLDYFPPVIYNTDFNVALYNYTMPDGTITTDYSSNYALNPHTQQMWTSTERINEIGEQTMNLPAFFDGSDSYIDVSNDLLFMNGFIRNYRYLNNGITAPTGLKNTYFNNLKFYDVTPAMLKLNSNKACYLLDRGVTTITRNGDFDSTRYSNAPSYIPYFSKFLTVKQSSTTSWIPMEEPLSLHINTQTSPSATLALTPTIIAQQFASRVTDTVLAQIDTNNGMEIGSKDVPGIYDKFWKNYTNDIYDQDTIKITAIIKITNPIEAMRTFYTYESKTFVIEKIFNYNATVKPQYCKVLLRRIKNTNNYN